MCPIPFQIFGLPVSAYGFLMMLAHLVGIAWLIQIARTNRIPLGPLLDMIAAVMITGLVGARLGYAFFHPEEFTAQPTLLFSLRKAGLSFYGGFLPAFFAFLAVLRWRRVPVLATADLVCPVLPFFLGIVRVGCFLEGCCYGAPTTVPWAVTFNHADSKVPPALLHRALHPSQLYECIFLLALSAALAYASARRPRPPFPPGTLATFSIFAYACYRLVADQFRGDLARDLFGVSWLSPTQGAAILGILATPLVLAICYRQERQA